MFHTIHPDDQLAQVREHHEALRAGVQRARAQREGGGRSALRSRRLRHRWRRRRDPVPMPAIS